MDSIQQAGIKKKNKSAFSRPSVSSFMIINLDQTVITESIVDTIVKTISER